PWSPAARWSSPATPPSAARSAASSTSSSPSRRQSRRPAGSGGEQQVEAAHGERDHRKQQRQLTGQLVPLREYLDRPLVRGDDAEDVTADHGQHLQNRQEGGVERQPVVDGQVAGP